MMNINLYSVEQYSWLISFLDLSIPHDCTSTNSMKNCKYEKLDWKKIISKDHDGAINAIIIRIVSINYYYFQ